MTFPKHAHRSVSDAQNEYLQVQQNKHLGPHYNIKEKGRQLVLLKNNICVKNHQ